MLAQVLTLFDMFIFLFVSVFELAPVAELVQDSRRDARFLVFALCVFLSIVPASDENHGSPDRSLVRTCGRCYPGSTRALSGSFQGLLGVASMGLRCDAASHAASSRAGAA